MSTERDHWVYRAWDADGRLLYIGCTKNLKQRRAAHATGTDSDWYPFATRFRAYGPYTYETARAIERQAIETEESYFNGTSEDHRAWLRWRRSPDPKPETYPGGRPKRLAAYLRDLSAQHVRTAAA